MGSVNLLPWREERRYRRDKRLLGVSIIYWLVCAAIVILMLSSISGSVSSQNKRNQFLIGHNARLNVEIKDVEQLKEDKIELLARIEIIQNLQDNRVQIVHVLDDMVRKLPSGVTLDVMSKQDKKIKLIGRAQSNSRVSELMNYLDSSLWFGKSDLTVVNVTDEENNKLSQFELAVTEKNLSAGKLGEAN
ncbi:MAG: type IV pilus assembly protein PilN [Saprospiraceae bacterium]|jgi:type IV pilus assembly protein PilN